MLEEVYPDFSMAELREDEHMFGLVSSEQQPDGLWLDSQRLPHNDVRWDHEMVKGPDGKHIVPQSFATVLGLTSAFSDTGTSIWRTNGTTDDPKRKLSLLSTLEQNESGQGAMNPWRDGRMHRDVKARDEIPDPHPQSILSHKWAEAILVSHLKFNRVSFYDGRRLHNQYLSESSYGRLSLKARTGRLTLNSFYWANSAKEAQKLFRKKQSDSEVFVNVADVIAVLGDGELDKNLHGNLQQRARGFMKHRVSPSPGAKRPPWMRILINLASEDAWIQATDHALKAKKSSVEDLINSYYQDEDGDDSDDNNAGDAKHSTSNGGKQDL